MTTGGTNTGFEIDWKTIATGEVGRDSFILLSAFSSLSSRSSVARLFLENREGEGHLPPRPHHSLPTVPKGSRAEHKGSGHCHSPQSPYTLKATFQSKIPPPTHPNPPPADRDGSERATVGHLQREVLLCSYLSASHDEEHNGIMGR